MFLSCRTRTFKVAPVVSVWFVPCLLCHIHASISYWYLKTMLLISCGEALRHCRMIYIFVENVFSTSFCFNDKAHSWMHSSQWPSPLHAGIALQRFTLSNRLHQRYRIGFDSRHSHHLCLTPPRHSWDTRTFPSGLSPGFMLASSMFLGKTPNLCFLGTKAYSAHRWKSECVTHMLQLWLWLCKLLTKLTALWYLLHASFTWSKNSYTTPLSSAKQASYARHSYAKPSACLWYLLASTCFKQLQKMKNKQ